MIKKYEIVQLCQLACGTTRGKLFPAVCRPTCLLVPFQKREILVRNGNPNVPYLFLVLIFAINQYGEGQNHDHEYCPELRCGRHGPAIRFPFQLKDRHPKYCGFPGFQLSCTHTKDTVLELPIPVKLFVKKIDYKSQEIHVYDPHGQCLPRQLLGINLSYISSDFHLKKDYHEYLDDYALFDCSHTKPDYNPRISCLGGSTHQVYALYHDRDIANWPKPPCTKVNNLISFPTRIIDGFDKILHLEWSRPACGYCEVQGLNCRVLASNSTDSETECFLKHANHTTANSTKSVATGAIVGSSVLILAVLFGVYRVYSYNKEEKENQAKIKEFLEDYKNFKPSRYSYADIKRITDRFTNMLGQGAYGTVFKGKLSNEVYVAVKILNASKGNGEEFINEVGTIGRIHHVNVVRLIGFCADGFRRALVYEFLPNDSLEKFISSADAKSCFLGWTKLQDIALGIANGIEYLHQGCDQRILHFDIKPRNILLDTNFNPRISDFGLAKLCSKDQSLVSMTTIRGTMGYIAPEVFSRNFGNVSYKADVFSFGMLLLEIVGGRKNMHDDVTPENAGHVYFPEWIYNFLEQKEDLRVFIEDEEDESIARKLAIVGLRCIQWHPVDRPSIKSVIQMLEGKGDKLIMPPNPFASIDNARINARRPTMHLNRELEILPEEE